MGTLFHHRVMVKKYGLPGVWELERRLRENGIDPFRGDFDTSIDPPIYTVDFYGPKDMNLDFLRPDFLPPRSY